jgi:hypothetical protein
MVFPLWDNGRGFSPVWDTTKEIFSIVGYNGRGFFRCGIQRKRFFSVVGYNGEK